MASIAAGEPFRQQKAIEMIAYLSGLSGREL